MPKSLLPEQTGESRVSWGRVVAHNVMHLGYLFFIVLTSFFSGGGWWSHAGAKSVSGRFLTLFTEFGILIVLAAYLGNITAIMVLDAEHFEYVRASSIQDVVSLGGTICHRPDTAMSDWVKKTVDAESLFELSGGSFLEQTAQGATMLRDGLCDAMLLPE